MALSDVRLTIEDGALGLSLATGSAAVVHVGTASEGPTNTLLGFGALEELRATLRRGPLLEAAAHVLSVTGGPVFVLRVVGEVPGTNKGVQGPAGAPAVTVDGKPADAVEGRIEIVAAGDLGVATFRVSLDGGDSVSQEWAVPPDGAFSLPEVGLSLKFAPGAYAAGAVYTWTSTAPGYTADDSSKALDALQQDPRSVDLVHIVGVPKDAEETNALATLLGKRLGAMATAYRYARGVIESPDVDDDELVKAFATFANDRVNVTAGYVELVSALSGRLAKRPAAWPIVARAAAVTPSTDLARVRDGALPGIVRLYRDEQKTPGLDGQRFTTLRTFVGRAGFYVAGGRLMAPQGSDFLLWQNGRVIDLAAATFRAAMLEYLNDDVRLNDDGTLYEADAVSIEIDVEARMREALTAPGFASNVRILVNRTDIVGRTRTLRAKARVTPLGYANAIEIALGFALALRSPEAA